MTIQEDAGDLSPEQPEHEEGLAGRAQDQVQSVAEQARVRAREQVSQRASELGAQTGGLAEDLRGVAEHLRSQGRDGPAGLVEQAAQRLTEASDYLRTADGERILHDAESLGRCRPWTAIIGGVATGMAASRLLKASSRTRYQTTVRAGTGTPHSGAFRPPQRSGMSDRGEVVGGYAAGAPRGGRDG